MTVDLRGLRVAVVGCGRMGAERAGRAAALGCKISGCVDADRTRAEQLASAHGAMMSSTQIGALPWRELDAVFVCTPPAVRREAVTRAIEGKVAVMVEKPIGLSATEGNVLAKAASEARVTNAVGYMNRYRASVRHCRQLLAQSPPSIITCHWASREYGVDWWKVSDSSGGPFNEQATHLIDLCRFVAGEVVDVRALTGGVQGRVDNATRFAVALLFASGAVGTMCYTCEAPDKFIAFEAITPSGALRLEGWDFAMTANTIDAKIPEQDAAIFELETRAFLQGAATNDESTIASSFLDAAKTQAVVDAIRGAAAR